MAVRWCDSHRRCRRRIEQHAIAGDDIHSFVITLVVIAVIVVATTVIVVVVVGAHEWSAATATLCHGYSYFRKARVQAGNGGHRPAQVATVFRRVRDLTTIAYTRCRRGIHRGAVIATGFVGHEAGVLVTAASSPTGRGDVGFVPLPVAAPLPVSMLTLVSMLALVPVLTLVPVLAIVPVSSLGLHLAAGAAVATVTDAVRAAACSSPPAVTTTATVVVVLVGAVGTGHFHCAAGTTTSPTTANIVATRTAGSVAG